MIRAVHDQGPTVIHYSSTKFNQGTIRQKGCNPRLNDTVGQVLSGSFFWLLFLDKQKK